MTLSSTSLSGTFNLSKYETPEIDDIGVTTKLSVTMNVNGPLANPLDIGDLGSTNI